jgi:hypothetical protein
MDQIFNLSAALAGGIFDLVADLGDGLAFPRHRAGCQMPFRVARYATGIKIGAPDDRTVHRRGTTAVDATLDRRLMQPALVALTRPIARRMAIDAIAAHRASVSVIEAKLSGDANIVGAASERGVTGQHAHRERCGRNENLARVSDFMVKPDNGPGRREPHRERPRGI